MKPFEKGIYLLPNLMTTTALFAGFYAVIAGMNGQYEMGAIAIFVAMVFDGLDGRIARMTNSCSAFGAEYDSLADMISFGLAPALLMYQWALHDFGKLGWIVAFIYTVAAALRLARFNTQVGVADKRYFQGLPSPVAAALLAAFVWMIETNEIDTNIAPYLALGFTLVVGLMMVSNIRFESFKELTLKGKVPFVTLLLVVLVLSIIALKPAMILFILVMAYIIYGPIMTLRMLQKKRFCRNQTAETSDETTVNEQVSSEDTAENAVAQQGMVADQNIEAISEKVSESTAIQETPKA